MFTRIFRGASVPHVSFPFDPDPPLRLDDSRLAAWARALDQSWQSTDPPPSRRVHRGQLPDVDFSNAVPVPRRPGLASRLFARLFGSGSSGRRVDVSGDADAPLGEAAYWHYHALVARQSDAAARATAEDTPQSRAA
jgi:hypothetical protein